MQLSPARGAARSARLRKRILSIALARRASAVILCLTGAHALAEQALAQVEITTASPLNPRVPFYYRLPERASPPVRDTQFLLLIPGCNGDGQAMIRNKEWTDFADRENLVLVAPTFKTDLDEIQSRRGYYYPALWSGKAALAAIEQIEKRAGMKDERVLMFGFSAGAHFVHRFANWKPDKVKAFVAYSAGWWDEPSPKLAGVPALIMCGEEDLRYGATQEFMTRAQALRLPWIWRGYSGTDHTMTPVIQRMAEAFLAHYLRDAASQPSTPNPQPPYIGDMQTYEVFKQGTEEAERVPAEMRVALPDKAVAEIWKQEQ